MTKDEVLKLALQYVESNSFGGSDTFELIDALREALAQPEHPAQMARLGWQYVECPACGSEGARAFPKPEQEPLEYWNAVEGWVKIDEVREHFDLVGCGTIYKTAGEGRTPLYTTPPQRTWVGLTDKEQRNIAYSDINCCYWGELMDAVEAKLKEKNS